MTHVLQYASGEYQGYRGERAARWWARVWYIIGGVLVPLFCWGISFTEMTKPEWQSGEWSNWPKLFLMGQVAWPLFPFFLYSMVCLTLMVVRREFFGHFLAVRLGLYWGVGQSLLFMAMLLAASGPVAGVSLVAMGGVVVVGALVIGVWWLTRLFGWIVLAIVGGLVGVALLVGVIIGLVGAALGSRMWFESVPMLALLTLGGGPAMAGLAFGTMVFWRWRHVREKARPVAATLWTLCGLGAYGAAWTAVVIRALEKYSELPTKPPHCYIATAAARGHGWMVGAERVRDAEGRALVVNRQLRVLKCGEVVLAALGPGLHRRCRRIYDAMGPVLAARLHNRWLADGVYLTLKPVEWATNLVLRLLGVRGWVERFYR